MHDDFRKDLAWSSKLFLSEVWPLCKHHLGGGELIPMEGRPDSELAALFDQHTGIDAWQLKNTAIRGIASRIQTGEDWRTFTVRKSRDSGANTEYKKRLDAITSNAGWLYPEITIQAYATTQNGPILSIGIARTKDIISFIQRGLDFNRRTTNATFGVCPWASMAAAGYAVKTVKLGTD